MVGQLLRAFPSIGHWPGTRFDLLDFHEWLNIANPLEAIQAISSSSRGTFAQTLSSVFWGYFLAHLGLGAAFAGWAIRRLRPVAAAAPLDGPPPEIIKTGLPKRPPVRDWPVYWKMLWCDSKPIKSRWNRTVLRLVYFLGFVPNVALLVIVGYNGGRPGVAEIDNIYIRMVGTMVLCGMLLFIAGLAASSIGRERQKQTLDELLLTDLSTDEILKQKWWASIWCMRWMMLWMAIHWAVAIALRRTAPVSGGGASDSLVLLRGTRSQSRPLLLGPNLDDAASALLDDDDRHHPRRRACEFGDARHVDHALDAHMAIRHHDALAAGGARHQPLAAFLKKRSHAPRSWNGAGSSPAFA